VLNPVQEAIEVRVDGLLEPLGDVALARSTA
jgi:hypothetical protein